MACGGGRKEISTITTYNIQGAIQKVINGHFCPNKTHFKFSRLATYFFCITLNIYSSSILKEFNLLPFEFYILRHENMQTCWLKNAEWLYVPTYTMGGYLVILCIGIRYTYNILLKCIIFLVLEFVYKSCLYFLSDFGSEELIHGLINKLNVTYTSYKRYIYLKFSLTSIYNYLGIYLNWNPKETRGNSGIPTV